MRIGIVGTGNMGRALGLRWAEAGHEICFGARRREVAEAAAALTSQGSTAGAPADAVPIRCGGLADAADVEAVARVLIAQIIQRGQFLLQMPIIPLEPPADPARLGERSGQ